MLRAMASYYSILLSSHSVTTGPDPGPYFVTTGALGSPGLLLSSFLIALAFHSTVILITNHVYLYPKSTLNQP